MSKRKYKNDPYRTSGGDLFTVHDDRILVPEAKLRNTLGRLYESAAAQSKTSVFSLADLLAGAGASCLVPGLIKLQSVGIASAWRDVCIPLLLLVLSVPMYFRKQKAANDLPKQCRLRDAAVDDAIASLRSCSAIQADLDPIQREANGDGRQDHPQQP